MPTKDRPAVDGPADFFIDITADVCPMTFVRTKLLIERMESGQTVEIRLRGAEPLANVPRAVTAQGHAVLSLEADDPEEPAAAQDRPVDPHRPHRLRVRKR